MVKTSYEERPYSMTDFAITATRKDGPDPDYRIDAFKVDGRWYTLNEMLSFMRGGHRFFVNVWGRFVLVLVKRHPRSGRFYLTTQADNFLPNNLLSLPSN